MSQTKPVNSFGLQDSTSRRGRFARSGHGVTVEADFYDGRENSHRSGSGDGRSSSRTSINDRRDAITRPASTSARPTSAHHPSVPVTTPVVSRSAPEVTSNNTNAPVTTPGGVPRMNRFPKPAPVLSMPEPGIPVKVSERDSYACHVSMPSAINIPTPEKRLPPAVETPSTTFKPSFLDSSPFVPSSQRNANNGHSSTASSFANPSSSNGDGRTAANVGAQPSTVAQGRSYFQRLLAGRQKPSEQQQLQDPVQQPETLIDLDSPVVDVPAVVSEQKATPLTVLTARSGLLMPGGGQQEINGVVAHNLPKVVDLKSAYPFIAAEVQFHQKYRSGQKCIVRIVEAFDPQLLVVVQQDSYDNYLNSVADLSSEISKELETLGIFTEMPPEGSLVCATDPNDEYGIPIWYRAELVEVLSKDTAQVYLVDVGSTTLVKLEHIRAMSEAWMSTKKFAVPVEISGLRIPDTDKTFSQQTVAEVKNLILGKDRTKKSIGRMHVEEDLNDCLRASLYLEKAENPRSYEDIVDVYDQNNIAF